MRRLPRRFPSHSKDYRVPAFLDASSPAPDELADPVIDRPRILEVPEFVPSPPALGEITIEPVQQAGEEKRPGIDIPLQAATLERRALSAVIDDLIIVTACSLFAHIFWKLTDVPHRACRLPGFSRVCASCCGRLTNILLMVYAGQLPGLRLARLKLLRFDDRIPSEACGAGVCSHRLLSAVSLCMGYIWVFLDEDSLCWHDRITHTYLAPQKHEPNDPEALTH